MLSTEENKRLSKLLSYVLRHNPDHLDLQLDNHGWADVEILLKQLNTHDRKVDLDILKHIVDTNAKKRFTFNEDCTLIRASQGHSIEIDLNYTARLPPAVLFHGTTHENFALIRENGLLKMSRHHVHLSEDEKTAHEVGQRHGRPVVLTVQSLMMYENGYLFYVSDNGVWLTDHVPVRFIG